MAVNFSIRCTPLNHKNLVPVDVSVHESPAIFEMVKVKEEDKAIVETEALTRGSGFELRFTKAGSAISAHLTNEQTEELRDYLISRTK